MTLTSAAAKRVMAALEVSDEAHGFYTVLHDADSRRPVGWRCRCGDEYLSDSEEERTRERRRHRAAMATVAVEGCL
jgi:hypothetical protein